MSDSGNPGTVVVRCSYCGGGDTYPSDLRPLGGSYRCNGCGEYFEPNVALEDNPSCQSCGADIGVSSSFPWHYSDEDCRGIKLPIESGNPGGDVTWDREHADECPVTRHRADLLAQLREDPSNEVLLGAVLEYQAGGDQEVESCTCGTAERDTRYVFDPVEERYWGPFADVLDAEAFVQSDKYLQSWCLTKASTIPGLPVYEPGSYHGEWPLQDASDV